MKLLCLNKTGHVALCTEFEIVTNVTSTIFLPSFLFFPNPSSSLVAHLNRHRSVQQNGVLVVCDRKKRNMHIIPKIFAIPFHTGPGSECIQIS